MSDCRHVHIALPRIGDCYVCLDCGADLGARPDYTDILAEHFRTLANEQSWHHEMAEGPHQDEDA